MRRKWIALVVAALIVSGAAWTPSLSAMWVSPTSWQNLSAFKYFVNRTVRYKPRSATDKTVTICDYRIDKTPINEKGIEVGVTKLSNGTCWAFRNITIKHCEISNLTRTPGWHSDFIRIFGGGSSKQDCPTTVHIEDVYVHDGDVLPLIIQDGVFDKITVKQWRHKNVATSCKIVTINTGTVDTLYIQDSPGISFSISGRPGSVKTVYVKNCPGSRVVDTNTVAGKTGCKIIYQ